MPNNQNPTNYQGYGAPIGLTDPNTGGILTTAANFSPGPSLELSVTTASSSGTFTRINPSLQAATMKITNIGTQTAYIGWGMTSATAVVPNGTTPTLYSDAVGPGAILTQDFYLASGSTGAVDTIAAITTTSTTTLLVTIGFGQ